MDNMGTDISVLIHNAGVFEVRVRGSHSHGTVRAQP